MLAIIIATLGRPELLMHAVTRLQAQTRPADHLLICATGDADLPSGWMAFMAGQAVTTVFSTAGSCTQRNAGLEWLAANTSFGGHADLAVFLDDDFVLQQDWLATAERLLAGDRQLVGLTGLVLADGAALAGYTEADALQMLDQGRSALPETDWRMLAGPVTSLYGCNMAVRGAAVRELRFDEALPLYAWLEDYDFSRRLAALGGLQRAAALRGVHLGTKTGRGHGRRLGYSQIANAHYLCRKGTMSGKQALTLIAKNVLANLARSARPEPFIDRRGRVRGNLDALGDFVRGCLHPGRLR